MGNGVTPFEMKVVTREKGERMFELNVPCTVPLGVAAALPDADHANTYLAVVGAAGRFWLVDCADSPIGYMKRIGLDPLNLQGVFFTHFHPDHVYGLPALLLGLYLFLMEGDAAPDFSLPLYARSEVLEGVKGMVNLFSSQNWIGSVPLTYHSVPAEDGAFVASDDDFAVTAAPTQHSVPSMAVRFEHRATGRAFVYSGDTQPSAAVETLAQGAALLFHEATGSSHGHSYPDEAGALAARANVERLVLIHYPPRDEFMVRALDEAGKAFGGDVQLAQALRPYPW